MRKIVVLIVYIINFATIFAQNFKSEGDDLVAKGNYSAAAAMYEQCMKQDEECLINFFFLIVEGKIEPQFTDELYNLISPLAEKEVFFAQYILGCMYYHGIGVEENDQKAFEFFQKSAVNEDNEDAQYYLSTMYQDGLGVKQDYQVAVMWYQKSAEQGEAIAQNNLAVMYRDGLGVKQDYQEAKKWFQKAAEQGIQNAIDNLRKLGL